MTERLKIFLWNEEIGMIIWNKSKKKGMFFYNPEFIKKGLEISPLYAPAKFSRATDVFEGRTEAIYQKLPPFIADSLPDQWGNLLFDRWRIENKIPLGDVTPLDKLAFIGSRGMGALEYRPETPRKEDRHAIAIDELARLSKRIYEERDEIRIDPTESVTLQMLISLGTSPGGRQPKAVIARNRTNGEICSGQTAKGDEYTHYIIKFGDSARGLAEIEMTYYEMALAAGLDMKKSYMREIDGTRHFITERYDRAKGEKLHTQTLAAMNPEADSYEQLIATCRMLGIDETSVKMIFRQMVFNIIANNTDDHNKNFSFALEKGGNWKITPAYDLNFIFNNAGFTAEKQHCLSMRGKLSDHTYEDLVSFARDNAINNPQAIINDVKNAVTRFREIAEKNHVPQKWIGRIENELVLNLTRIGLSEKPETSDAELIQQYKGNFELNARIDGIPHRYIITERDEDYYEIEKASPARRAELIPMLIEKHLMKK